ncbi:MAG: nucleotide exchange factor GrpE [Acidobacteria bacterium]|nr:nucleotide exchange factor GrpE [Acidobacteriota bacterium]MYK87692.1 nucleotide exchange factor GrpE [Acidobacteriota bacterium]MYN64972.1 nucleotide exchange factor GrpE [Acidobacteriota bacterium]
MTDDVNPAQPEDDANPAQTDENAEPAQTDEEQPAEDAGPAQADEEPAADPVPPAAGPVPDPAAERDEYRDLLLRKQAEFDNFKKRVERDRAKANRQAERVLIVALLPLLDDFERALGASTDAGGIEAYRAGIELIHRQLLETLRKRGVTSIDTDGARFDPNLHEAVAYQASEGREDGDVIDELRRGYLFHEELLRAAMVRVAKA